jgi:23S rRNA (cytidine2498-2'-O)-methyltransferase
MSKQDAQFVFMTCRTGAEAALKQEVAHAEPEWRLSYSRPGFLTFKRAGKLAINDRQLAERSWTFAHAHGISLGRLTGSSLSDLAAKLWCHEGVVKLLNMSPPADLHVWQREPMATDDRGSESFVTPLSEAVDRAVRAAAPSECAKLHKHSAERRTPTLRHRHVLDVVVVEPGEWWIGHHLAVTLAERWPGGAIPVALPEHAVSRAYAKLEEAVAWSGLPLAAVDECVEIGCAPGGASQALLDRGLFVTGIDPAEVDATVVAHPRFRHLRKRGHEVPRKEFVGVRWLVADMNIAPDAALDEIQSIVTHPQLALRGLIITLKLADWSVAERLPELATRVRGWGYRDVRMRQLVSGGQEVCLVALRRRELRRLGRKKFGKQASRPHEKPAALRRRDEEHKALPRPHF